MPRLARHRAVKRKIACIINAKVGRHIILILLRPLACIHYEVKWLMVNDQRHRVIKCSAGISLLIFVLERLQMRLELKPIQILDLVGVQSG